MKISKQLLLIAPALFLFFFTGCSKSLSPTVNAESKSDIAEPDPEYFKEENVGEFETFSEDKEWNLLPGEGGDAGNSPDNAEPFLSRTEPFLLEKDGATIASLFLGDKDHRKLPYQSSDKLLDMFFAFDSYDLDDQLLKTLQANAEYLKAHPFSRIVLQGYCDERGSNNYNLSLGNQRANSVKSYLVLLGVDESRINTVSFGEENPSCLENNEKCWYQNRRVSFLIAEKIESAAFTLNSNTSSLVLLKNEKTP
jgi:peptidoglycan-associated lipoprotein